MGQKQGAENEQPSAGSPDPHGTAELTPRDRARLLSVLGGFPGGSASQKLIGLRHDRRSLSVDDLVEVISDLSQICGGWAEENVRLRREIEELERQRDEVRKFLGPVLGEKLLAISAPKDEAQGDPRSVPAAAWPGDRNTRDTRPRKFSVVDGVDGDTLGCDCYGGCWGEHSKNWPSLHFGCKNDAATAWRLCHQELEVGVSRPKAEQVGHGNYVLGRDDSIRFATRALLDAHVRRLEQVLGW